jgi:hypothetical protein
MQDMSLISKDKLSLLRVAVVDIGAHTPALLLFSFSAIMVLEATLPFGTFVVDTMLLFVAANAGVVK